MARQFKDIVCWNHTNGRVLNDELYAHRIIFFFVQV